MATELKLPGSFTEGKPVLWKGGDAKAWHDNLIRDRIIVGDGLTEEQTSAGRKIAVENAGDVANLDLQINSVFIDGDGNVSTTNPTTTFCWRSGLFVGAFPVGSEPPQGSGNSHFALASLVGGC